MLVGGDGECEHWHHWREDTGTSGVAQGFVVVLEFLFGERQPDAMLIGIHGTNLQSSYWKALVQSECNTNGHG